VSRAHPLSLHEGDDQRLAELCRSTPPRSPVLLRARIVLLAAEGLPTGEIARRTGASLPTVAEWRKRYEAGGLAALTDRPRSGRPREIDEIKVIVASLTGGGQPPGRLGTPHWTARSLGAELGVSFATVARIWRQWELDPGEPTAFRFATRPVLDAESRDVVGLFLHPPHRVVVLSPQQPGRAGPPHDCLRLVVRAIAAEPAGPARSLPAPEPLLRFLTDVAAAHPGRRLDVLLDDAGPTHPRVSAWIAARPRFVPYAAGSPWLPVTQVLFGIASCQVGRPAAADGLSSLAAGILGYPGARPATTALSWLRPTSGRVLPGPVRRPA
jgi:transposase